MRSQLFHALASTLILAFTVSLAVTAPAAFAGETKDEAAKKAEEEQQNAKIKKSFEELKAAVQNLATQIGEQIDETDTTEAKTWVRTRLAELEASLQSAGKRLEEESDAAGEDARQKTGDLLKGLADAVGSLGESVAKSGDELKAKGNGGEAERPAADSVEK